MYQSCNFGNHLTLFLVDLVMIWPIRYHDPLEMVGDVCIETSKGFGVIYYYLESLSKLA